MSKISLSHFVNGLKCRVHNHGASCAVDTLLEIFYYAIYRNARGKLNPSHISNELFACLWDVSTQRGITQKCTCEMRDIVWNYLVHQLPNAFYPKGRNDAEIVQAFDLLGKRMNHLLISHCDVSLQCGTCFHRSQISIESNSVVTYYQSLNENVKGDFEKGIEATMFKHAFNQANTQKACMQCQRDVFVTKMAYKMADIVIIPMGLLDAQNMMTPPVCVKEDITLYGNRYHLEAGVLADPGHFVAFVADNTSYMVLDDMQDNISHYATFSGLVSGKPNDFSREKTW